MPAFNKFNQFTQDVGQGVHNLNVDTLNIFLTNTAPAATDTAVDTTAATLTLAGSGAAEIAAQNGYAKGGAQMAANAFTQSAGVGKLTGNAVTYTAAVGSFGPWRYAVLYNVSKGVAAARPILGWWDYGSSVSTNVGDAFKVGKDATGANWDATIPAVSIT